MSLARSRSSQRARRRVVVVPAALAVTIGLGGCVSLLPKAKPVQLYRFGSDASAPVAAGTTAVARQGGPGGAIGVVLLTPVLPRAAVGDGILTLNGDKAAYIAGARWLGPAATLFQEDAQAAFDARGRRVRLVDRGQLALAGALLRLEVGHFEVRYDSGAPVVVVSVRATLTSSDGRASVQQSFSQTAPAAVDRISAIVSAFDQAADATLDAVVAWTDASAPALVRAAPASGETAP